MSKKLKKGFTLAELLIVVAIIAVLTAIAVPLFVTSLTKAQNATKDANKRAVRGAAVAYILEQEVPTSTISTGTETSGVYSAKSDKTGWELVGPWKAVAELDKSGNIKTINVTITTAEEQEAYVETTDKITVTIVITKLTYTNN